MDYIGLLLTSSAAAQQFKQAWLHSPCTMIQPALAKSEIQITARIGGISKQIDGLTGKFANIAYLRVNPSTG